MTGTAMGSLGGDVDQAAGLLAAVGRAADGSVDAGVPLRCLCAAEGLCAAGAIPADVARLVDDADVIAAAIRTALELLAAVPLAVFAQQLVSDAAADARAALTLIA